VERTTFFALSAPLRCSPAAQSGQHPALRRNTCTSQFPSHHFAVNDLAESFPNTSVPPISLLVSFVHFAVAFLARYYYPKRGLLGQEKT
jgi:hypothetical protein